MSSLDSRPAHAGRSFCAVPSSTAFLAKSTMRPSRLYRSRRKTRVTSIRIGPLQRVPASLVVSNPDGIVDTGKKNLSIADLAGTGGGRDGFHRLFHEVVVQHDF